MISLALFSTNSPSPIETGEAATPAGEGKGANGAFSALLAALGGQQADAEGKSATTAPSATATLDSALPAVESGIALPAAAETGKTLPDVAAAAAADTPEDEADAEAGSTKEAEGNVAATAVTAPLLQLPPVATTPDASMAAQAKTAAATGGSPLPSAVIATPAERQAAERATAPSVALHVAPEAAAASERAGAPAAPLRFASAATPAPTKRPAGERTETPSSVPHVAPGADAVGEQAETRSAALHVAPKADTQRLGLDDVKAGPELQVKARHATVEGLTPKSASADMAPQTPPATFAQGPQAESTVAGRMLDSPRPAAQADALQELTRIVDRLAAAREALAPTAAALAVKHADFGELSLRFDQQRDGHLAVQLSAADPDAHRAVAAAVSERGAAAPADSHTGSSHSQAQARGGAAAERDGNGSSSTTGGNAARQDQPQQRRSAPQHGGPDNGARRAGIFA